MAPGATTSTPGDAGLDAANATAERIRRAVERTSVTHGSVTVGPILRTSIGIATFPEHGGDDAALIALARQAGAGDATADCINGGSYTATVAGMADATNVEHTPTVRINGQYYDLTTPDALVARVKELVGPVPGIDAPTQGSTRPS